MGKSSSTVKSRRERPFLVMTEKSIDIRGLQPEAAPIRNQELRGLDGAARPDFLPSLM
jgi:hypothetical protein